MSADLFDLAFEDYIKARTQYIVSRCKEEPVLNQLMGYEGAWTFTETNWAREYWFHKAGELS